MCVSGMNKIVINHLDKTFVTSDASVMMTELEVQHPAAKLIVMAAKSQENEVGDGTNMVRVSNLLCTCQPGLHHYREHEHTRADPTAGATHEWAH